MSASPPPRRRWPIKSPGPPTSWPPRTLLATLSDPDRAALLRLGRTKVFPAEETMILQGDPSGDVYLLLDGIVKVVGREENGTETLLGTRVSGDVVGEMAVLGGTVRSATVITCGRTVAGAISGPAFLNHVRGHPAVGVALVQMTADRLRWSNQRRMDSAAYAAGVCLARILLLLAERHGQMIDGELDLGVRLSQAELGALIGAKEVTVQKALRQLAADGLVRPGHRRVVILDSVGLTEIAQLAAVPRSVSRNPYQ